jgi:diguanylate cyclase (GGDEF)-like protein
MDLDHFKCVNDRYGHTVGDQVLKMVANTMQHCTRVFDLVGRWGGEEFIALITNINTNSLESVAERIRRMVAASELHHEGQAIQITLSIGAAVTRPGIRLDQLLDEADQLLYRSKMNGRNHVSYQNSSMSCDG